jgi:hypothetical protein
MERLWRPKFSTGSQPVRDTQVEGRPKIDRSQNSVKIHARWPLFSYSESGRNSTKGSKVNSRQNIVIGLAIMGASSVALAQDAVGPMPDPTHIPFVLSKDIKWQTGGEKSGQRSEVYPLFGDVNKPGPYALLLKWLPGNMSRPHFHEKTRYITVLSGHWWVSSSNVFDPSKTYPLPPGTLVQDVANTVHLDGAKNETVVLEIMGDGTAPNIDVDETGKPTSRPAPGK